MKTSIITPANTAPRFSVPHTLKIHAEPLALVNEIEERVAQRAFELFERRGYAHGQDLSDWLIAESELFGKPTVEIVDQNGTLAIRAQVPGFKDKDINLTLDPLTLVIHAKKEHEQSHKDKNTLCETAEFNEIFRRLELPAKVNTERAIATLNNGVLEIKIPKATTEQVTVKSAA